MWLNNVHRLLAYHRPDVAPGDLDPNASWQAYQQRRTPQDFATQSVLPLRPTSSRPQAIPLRTVSGPSIDLIAWMWGLTALGVLLVIAGGLSGSGAVSLLALLVDLPALVVAIVLVRRPHTTDRINGWVKVGLEVSACLSSFLLVVMR
ncbi:MAG: hypothetical protein EOO70_08085 [Myxococcaceae bacterium]|nr:MAG: hypothetical protein EOO70_08085 [Myxococcaceae bacterium]